MKLNKSVLHTQRQQLDRQLSSGLSLKKVHRPRRGWIKAIREALGMSSQQLAEYLNTDKAAVLRLEDREVKGTVTLESLDRAARAMGCKLVYAIVPEESLEELVDQKARKAALKILGPVSHSMSLEAQEVDEHISNSQLDSLAKELKAKLDPALWKK
ncbi:MAG: mobile mystery protein A [Bdellovibrionia bacterium]